MSDSTNTSHTTLHAGCWADDTPLSPERPNGREDKDEGLEPHLYIGTVAVKSSAEILDEYKSDAANVEGDNGDIGEQSEGSGAVPKKGTRSMCVEVGDSSAEFILRYDGESRY